ncbi:MAG TPA: molybdenum cofactor guanylyltransferase [Polyangiaceae bacterium]|nr:molybdenum cofactor guanylyltransferase [Polyangiaceae bacterium]
MTLVTRLSVGLFVGGRGLRMGGVPKGMLKLRSGQTLIERLLGEVSRAYPRAQVYLVGAATEYQHLGLRALTDDPPGIGPLGGLRALLREAETAGATHVLALACDLPYVASPLLARLAEEAPAALALAAKQDGYWQPLCARYSVALEAAADELVRQRRHSLQALFEGLGESAVELGMSPSELTELKDWDRPEDLD